jgi:hypothetical protein
MAVAEVSAVAGNGGDVIFTVSWTSTVLLGLGVSSLPFFFPAEGGASEVSGLFPNIVFSSPL